LDFNPNKVQLEFANLEAMPTPVTTGKDPEFFNRNGGPANNE